MTTVDLVIIVLFAIPGTIGALYGFLNMAFSILAWVISLLISVKFSYLFAPLLAGYIDAEIVQNVIAFVGVFVITLLIMTAIGYFVAKLLGRPGLTIADRFLGFLLGVGLGGFIIIVVVFLAGFTAYPKADAWQDSALIPPFERLAVWMERYFPESVTDYHSYDF